MTHAPIYFERDKKKYDDNELKKIIADNNRPIFVAERAGNVLGHAFCIHQQHINDHSLTGIKTL